MRCWWDTLKQDERMHFTNRDILLLLLTTLQFATGVFCRSYGDDKHTNVTKLITNAARMRAGFPPLKPRNLNMPSRVQDGGKIKYFYFIFIPISFPLSLIKYEREIHRRQWYFRMCRPGQFDL